METSSPALIQTLAILHFHLASIHSHSSATDVLQKALTHARLATGLLARVSNYKMMGQASILLSSLEPEDDDAISAFEAAVCALKKAQEEEPDNEDVRMQLRDLEGVE